MITKDQIFVQFKTFALLILIKQSHGLHQLVPNNKEYIYNYKATIVAQTDQPAEYASQFQIHGYLHLQSFGDFMYFNFDNLQYRLYNGKVGNILNAKDVKIPSEIEDLYKTFIIEYDGYGKIKHFYRSSQNEKEFSINIKKSVANIFQINKKAIYNKKNRTAFIDKEHTPKGITHVNYNVRKDNNDIIIHKLEETDNMVKMFKHILINAEIKQCQDEFENPVSYDNQKEYILVKTDDDYTIKKAFSSGGIYLHPFQAQSEAYYVFSNVSFTLHDIRSVNKVQKSPEMAPEFLDYKFFADGSKNGQFPDVFQDRRSLDNKKIAEEVIHLLNQIVNYLNQHHIHTDNYDFTQGQVINDIQNIMMSLDLETIKILWEQLKHDTKDERREQLYDVYKKVLVIVGTEASVTQIIENTMKYPNNINNGKLLEDLPMNLKTSSYNLLKKIEKLLELNPETKVGKAGILSFGSLLYKSCKFIKCSEELLNKYVVKLIEKYEKTPQFKIQSKMVYFGALYNLEMKDAKPFFVDLIKHEDNKQFSLLAMWGVYPLVKKNEERLFKLYYPIFTDANLPTHQRILAYYLIMEANPSLQKMWMIHYDIQKDANHAIYQFYYKYLNSIAKSDNACRRTSKLYAKQLLRYTHPPSYYGLTGSYILDYNDNKYGSGKALDTFFVLDKHTALLKISTQYNFFNMPINPITIWVKAQGMEAIEKIALKTQGINSEMFNFEEVIQLMLSEKLKNNASVEVFLFQNDKVYNVYYFKDTALPELFMFNIWNALDNYGADLSITSKIYTKAFFASEIGFPVTLDWVLPGVSYFKVDMQRTYLDGYGHLVKLDTVYKSWMHSRYGLSFYNSICDVFQGIQRLRSFDSAIPILVDIIYNKNPFFVTFEFDKHNDTRKSTGGYRNHVTSITYIKDDMKTGALKISSPDSKATEIISKGDGYRHTYPDGQLYFGSFGYDYSLTVYDSERKITNTSMKKPDYFFNYPKNSNWNPSLTNLYKLYMQKWDRMLYQPFPATYGIIEKFEPSLLYPTTHQFSFAPEYSFHPNKTNPHLPGMSFKLNITTVDFYAGEPQITSQSSIKYELAQEHTQQILEIQSQSIENNVPASPKMCILAMQKWEKEQTLAYFSFSQNPPKLTQGCTQEGTIFAMTMKGVKSTHQNSDLAVYGECDYSPSPNGVRHKLLSCYNAYDTFRNYTFDINIIEEPDRITEKISLYVWDMIKTSLYKNYKFVEHPSEFVEDGRIKITLTYPMKGQSYNIHVLTNEHEYQFDGLENMWVSRFFGLKTEHSSFLFKVLHNIGLTNYCSVYNDTVNFKYDAKSIQLASTWTLLAGHKENEPNHGIYARQVQNNLMALQLVHNGEKLTITPEKLYHFKVDVDGEVITNSTYTNDWFYFRQIPHTDFITIIYFHMGANLYYDGAHVHVDIPKMDFKHFGLCYRN